MAVAYPSPPFLHTVAPLSDNDFTDVVDLPAGVTSNQFSKATHRDVQTTADITGRTPPCGWSSYGDAARRVGQTTQGAAGRCVNVLVVRLLDDEAVNRQSGHGRRRRVRERLTGPRFLGSILVCRTGYPVNRLTVNIPTLKL